MEEEDDDWASEWTYNIEGPGSVGVLAIKYKVIPTAFSLVSKPFSVYISANSTDPGPVELADMYTENGFDTSEKAVGITLYLIAKTLCSFTAFSLVSKPFSVYISANSTDPGPSILYVHSDAQSLYLIAKTLCSFISVRSEVQSNIPICIGFHDQDPIKYKSVYYFALHYVHL
jgi:hypothetical protein